MSNQALIEFKPKLPKLSKNEQAVLKLLIEAGKLVAPLYIEQEKGVKKSLNDAELEAASKKNPDVLSAFNYVEKVGGKVVITPYHIKYAKFLQPIADLLIKASQISDNKDFANALKIQAEALIGGNYEKSIATWLKFKLYILDISISPVEKLDDQLPLSKASYQAWVGVLDKDGTERLNNYRKTTLSAQREALIPEERIDNFGSVKAKTIDVVLLAGFMARTRFVGVNLPMNLDLVEKYGSEITIFNQPNDLRMKERIIPIFNKIFPKEFREEYSFDDLRRGYLRTIALHELAHSFLYYKHSERNLREYFQIIDELAATVLGLRMAGSLLLKDRITTKQLESMIVTFLCRCYYSLENHEGSKSGLSYVNGNSVFINYLFENGALRKSGTTVVINFMKIFMSLHDLSEALERLLASGNKGNAYSFIKKYS